MNRLENRCRRIRMEKEKRKMRPAWIVLTGLVSAGILAFGLLLVFISIQEGKVVKKAEDLKDDFDAVIVLGAQVKPDGEPSVQLAWRLDTAAEVWKMKNVPVVVCGAKGKDEPEEEAYAMKRYLEGKGIPPDMILTDPDSFNTEQNLKHAKKLLDEYPESVRKVVIVTSDYHVPRSMALAGDLGMTATGIGSPCLQEFWIKNHARESLAWCKYWVNKYFHLKL